MQGHDDLEISAALKDAERAGFRLMLFGHTAILAVSSAGFTYGYWLYGNPSGPILPPPAPRPRRHPGGVVGRLHLRVLALRQRLRPHPHPSVPRAGNPAPLLPRD